MRAPATIALALAFAGLVAACKAAPVEIREGGAPNRAAEAPIDKPLDHLAPGELLEGTEKAFGMVLPRDTQIERTFKEVVYVRGQVPLAPLVQYLRAHVREGTFTKGQLTATFDHVKIPGEPGRELMIRVNEMPGQATRIELRDVTPQPIPDLPNEEERWRQVGQTKDGKVLDPKHLE